MRISSAQDGSIDPLESTRSSTGRRSGQLEVEPDDFYLNAAIDWLSHNEPGPRPAFLYLSTMWNHSPHDVRAFDDNGERMTTKISDTEFDEYLRRLRSTCADYANFRAKLAGCFPRSRIPYRPLWRSPTFFCPRNCLQVPASRCEQVVSLWFRSRTFSIKPISPSMLSISRQRSMSGCRKG